MASVLGSLTEIVLVVPRWLDDQLATDAVQNAREAMADSKVRRSFYEDTNDTEVVDLSALEVV